MLKIREARHRSPIATGSRGVGAALEFLPPANTPSGSGHVMKRNDK